MNNPRFDKSIILKGTTKTPLFNNQDKSYKLQRLLSMTKINKATISSHGNTTSCENSSCNVSSHIKWSKLEEYSMDSLLNGRIMTEEYVVG